jgi:hypothetical protein
VVLVAAVVIVQVLPRPPAEDDGERLITACTQGLRQGACVLANEAPVERGSSVVAEVRWEDETFRVAVIRLGRPQAGEHEWISGKVAFDDGDSLPDRWTTAGFTIATLAGDLTPAPAPASARPAEPAGPVTRVTPRPERGAAAATEPPRRGASVRIAAGAAFGQAMHEQPPRTGPWATVAYSPSALPLGPRVRGSVAWADGAGAKVRWVTAAVGLESHLPLHDRVALVLAADGGPSFLSASSDRTQHRVFASFSLFAGCALAISDRFSLVGGAGLDFGPTTALNAKSGLVADRRFKLGGLVGVAAEL